MATVPPGIPSLGTGLVIWADTVADTSAPKVTELTSTTAALDLSCYLETKWNGLSTKVEMTKDERYCTKEVLERIGSATVSVDELLFVIDPQNPTSLSAKAETMLTEGKAGFLVLRPGKDVDTPVATGDKVTVVPVQLGPADDVKGDGQAPWKRRQIVSVIGPVVRRATVAA